MWGTSEGTLQFGVSYHYWNPAPAEMASETAILPFCSDFFAYGQSGLIAAPAARALSQKPRCRDSLTIGPRAPLRPEAELRTEQKTDQMAHDSPAAPAQLRYRFALWPDNR